MKKPVLWVRAILSVMAAISLTGVTAAEAQENPVERGKYLVERVAFCSNCHTPRDASGQPDQRRR